MPLPLGLDVEWGVEGFEGPRQDQADVLADPVRRGVGVPVERLLDDSLKVSAGNSSEGCVRFSMSTRRLRTSTLGLPCAAVASTRAVFHRSFFSSVEVADEGGAWARVPRDPSDGFPPARTRPALAATQAAIGDSRDRRRHCRAVPRRRRRAAQGRGVLPVSPGGLDDRASECATRVGADASC